jgi:sterol desaturase/sphingolipid hydroxylase (fatty acid hydroxylase superfamily)
VNFLFIALAFTAAAVFVRPTVGYLLDLNSTQPIGLVPHLPGPGWLKPVTGFLLMDLSFYYWHRANHRIQFLWRFHNVHHIDPELDVSTGFRFHFGEVALSSLFRIAQVTLIGMSPLTYFVYELIFQANTLFHHSNVRLPIQFERGLNRFLVTPRMHGIHHSQVQIETNSNYSVVLPWWDRLHRTLKLNIPQSALAIGIPGYSNPDDNRFWQAAFMPFRKQRDYWTRPDGRAVSRETSSPINKHRLAE